MSVFSQDIAEESWHKYLQRNQSVIVRVFQGQLKSTLICPKCKLVRRTITCHTGGKEGSQDSMYTSNTHIHALAHTLTYEINTQSHTCTHVRLTHNHTHTSVITTHAHITHNTHVTLWQVSKIFDPFMFLSLPLPIKKTRTLLVSLVRADPSQQVYRVRTTVAVQPT